MICKYALDSSGNLVFIDDVKNGLECNCKCPSCGEKMIAKNNGKIKDRHFAHESGHTCEWYRETLLHIWSKEIIENEKTIMAPEKDSRYKFPDKFSFVSVELEKEDSITKLKPDIIAITEDGLQLWIEIAVSHKCEDIKINKIKENNINCLEVEIPTYIESKEKLKEFLIDEKEDRCFINFPFGTIIETNIEEIENESTVEQKSISIYDCRKCFTRNDLQTLYKNLLGDYTNLKDKYFYIFKYDSLDSLINKYPKLVNLFNSLCYQKDISNDELEFAGKLRKIYKYYEYGYYGVDFTEDCPNSCPYYSGESNSGLYIFCNKK